MDGLFRHWGQKVTLTFYFLNHQDDKLANNNFEVINIMNVLIMINAIYVQVVFFNAQDLNSEIIL